MFKKPYIDVDEWRDKPVRHRYVHGGFKGTDARFSFYFPQKERYQGRFFQHITPAPGGENLEQHATGVEDQISFAIESGGYFIETNEGGPTAMMNPSVSGFRVNAAAAKYSRTVAAEMYGPHRTYGYAWGGKRRRLQDDKRIREYRRVGRCRAVCHRITAGHSQRFHSAHLCHASPVGQVSFDP